jgi:hypothetical protein
VGCWYAILTPVTALKEEFVLFAHPLHRLISVDRTAGQVFFRRWLLDTKPTTSGPVIGTPPDLVRSKPDLVVENALLRQQLIILRRSVKRPHCTAVDRALLVLLASRLRTRHQSLRIVQPGTLLR